MSESWKQLEGQVVDAKYHLQKYLAGDQDHAVFLTSYGESEAKPAAIKLVSEDSRSKRLLQQWRRAEKLSHPHLMQLFTSGRAKVNDMPVLYVVMEYAEENLGEVLTQRALTPEEAPKMLKPALSGLDYVHSEGFIHGHLQPGNIYAVDGSLRISSDELSRAGDYGPSQPGPYDPPELTTEGYSTAGDVWSLGVTLVESMTQQRPVWDPKGIDEPSGTESMPTPFGEIARGCLRRNPRSRLTVGAIEDLLLNRPSRAVRERPAPVRSSTTAERPTTVLARQAKESRGVPHKLIYALSGILALILLGIIFGPGLRTHTDGLPVTSTQQPGAPKAVDTQAESTAAAKPPEAQPVQRGKKNRKEKNKVVAERVPARVNPALEAASQGAPPAKAPATSTAVSGDVVQQVLPDITTRARRSIHGRVRVAVKVTVDAAGNVVNAELASSGPSQYFAQEALQASRKWKFGAAKDGDGARTFTLNYQFLSNDTKVVPSTSSR